MYFFAVMIRRPPRPTRMDTRCPDPPLFRSLGQVETFQREAQAGFAAYLAGHLDELRPIDVELAAFVCVASIEAVTHGAVLYRPDLLKKASVDALVDETTRLVVGYQIGRAHV